MDPKSLMPFVFTALLAFAIYRRVRRNIGRQVLSPGRLGWRIALFAVVGALVLATAARELDLLASMLGGLAAGIVLAWVGLRHTLFEVTPQGRYYTPHTYIGAAVSALFLARIAYRFFELYSASHAHAAPAGDLSAYQRSPLTLATFGVLAGYYVAYYTGILRRNRELAAAANDEA
jgi:hypothetical protein